MSGDQRRDRQQSETKSRPAVSSGRAPSPEHGHPSSGRMPASAPVSGAKRRDASAPASTVHRATGSEFEAPTRPRGYTVSDSEPPTALRPSEAAQLAATQDSFHPVRVPPRTVHPPIPMWKRAWATAALVIVVLGGAVGIVAGLRGRAFFAGGRSHARDRAAAAAPAANVSPPIAPVSPTPRAASTTTPLAAPASTASPLAIGPTPPTPLAALSNPATPLALPPSTLPPVSIDTLPTAAPVAASPPRTSASAPAARPITVTPASRPIAAAPWPRPKSDEPAPRAIGEKREEAAPQAPPAPTTSDLPGTKGESEAWVTEERRF